MRQYIKVFYSPKLLVSFLLILGGGLPLVTTADDKVTGRVIEHISMSGDALIEERDFQKLSKIMRRNKLPLLVEFHADECPYCKQLEDEFLNLMVGTPDYDKKIIIRKLKIDSSDEVINFDGKEITASEFAEQYNAYVTPTMVFLDADGNQVAEKMVGINTPSLFGAYIDDEIEKALTSVRAEKPSQKGE